MSAIESAAWWKATCRCGKPGCWAPPGDPVYVPDEERTRMLATMTEGEAKLITWRLADGAAPSLPARVMVRDEHGIRPMLAVAPTRPARRRRGNRRRRP